LRYELAGNELLVLLPLSGLPSGLLTCAFMSPAQQEAGIYCGVVFGSFLAIPLATSGILDSGILYCVLKALGLIAVSTAAYFLACMAAIGMQLNFPQVVPRRERWDMGTNEPASAIALFVGGLVGGFLVFAGLIFLSRPEINKFTRTRKIILGTLLGGLLEIAGWALRSSIGAATWHLLYVFGLTPPWELSPRAWFHGVYDYGQRSRMYSRYFVWQTGVAAAAAGVMLRDPFGRKQDSPGDLRLFNSRY
jgi:hypothetical protein